MLALLAAVIAPFFIDWTAYRGDFEREVSRILGREVVVGGEASARLLPFPSVTLTDVALVGESGEPVMSIDRFRMDAELAPLLSGEIRIYSMQLESPELQVTVDADGTFGWTAGGPDLPVGASVVLESVSIENGTIIVHNALTDRTHELTDIDAVLSADSLRGPFDGAGTLFANEEPLAVSFSAGEIAEGEPLSLRVTADSVEESLGIVLDGAIERSGEVPRFAGYMHLASLPPAAPERIAAAPPAQAVEEDAPVSPFRVEGRIALAPTEIELEEMQVEIGPQDAPYRLSGSAGIDLAGVRHFELSLKGEQVDVDRLASGGGEAQAGEPAEESAEPAEVSFSERMGAVEAVVQALPRPAMPGIVNIDIPIVAVGDTTIRSVRFSASPTDDGWSIEEGSAELPGRTLVEASGLLTVDGLFRFRGDLLLASRQPSGFADWLTGSVDPSIRVLSRAGFSANVDLSAAAQILEDLEVIVGANDLHGRIARSTSETARLIAADLTGEAIDLDAFLALASLFTGSEDALAEADRLTLRLSAGPVSYNDLEAESIDADLFYDGDTLTIGTLAVEDLAGAEFSIKGQLDGLESEPEGQLALSLAAQDPAAILELLDRQLPDSAAVALLKDRASTLGPLSLDASIDTLEAREGESAPSLAVQAVGSAAGTDFDASLALGHDLGNLFDGGKFGLQLRLGSEMPPVLMEQLGLETLDVLTPSPLIVELELSGTSDGPVVASASLRAPGTEMSASGTLEFASAALSRADLSLIARSEDIGPWLLATGTVAGQSVDALPVNLAGALVWSNEDWRMNDVAGEIGDVTLQASFGQSGEETIAGSAALSRLSLPWLARLVYGRPPGEELWSSEAFQPSLLPEEEFRLDVTASRLTVPGLDDIEDFRAVAAGSGSQLVFEDASGRFAGGRIVGTMGLRNADGIGGFSLDAETTGVDLTRFTGLAGTLSANANLAGTGQSYAGLVSSLTGAGAVRVAESGVPGIAADALAPILAAANAEGFEPTVGRVEAVLDEAVAGERFPIESVATEFSVAGGVVRFAPVTVEASGTKLTLDGRIDLATMTAEADLRLAFDPGEEDQVEGAEPVILYSLGGSLAAPEIDADLQPLTSYLSVRALEREQDRIQAMQESLRETLRLRREARLYRWREAERERRIEERRALEAAETAERARREAAARAALEPPEQVPTPSQPPEPPPADSWASDAQPAPAVEPESDAPAAEEPPNRSVDFDTLPGVNDPIDF